MTGLLYLHVLIILVIYHRWKLRDLVLPMFDVTLVTLVVGGHLICFLHSAKYSLLGT